MHTPWLSVITVVKDDAKGFARTAASVSQQNLEGVEYIVVDSSTERQDVPAMLESVDLTAKYSWQEPRGIYPAMNAGLQAATGDFVYFANAGDTFFRPDVLSRTRPLVQSRDWAFGPVEIIERDGHHVFTPSWEYSVERASGFSRGFFPAHQGTFAKRSLVASWGGFDARYSIAADYAMALRLSQASDPVVLPFVVATFREGGASTVGWQESFRQFHAARREILAPTGASAAREQWNTGLHFAKVWANRELRPRIRGSR